jgi:hypothetical protein
VVRQIGQQCAREGLTSASIFLMDANQQSVNGLDGCKRASFLRLWTWVWSVHSLFQLAVSPTATGKLAHCIGSLLPSH